MDRMAVAAQVIRSAGEVLQAAGFSREEIGSFFRQAADGLEGHAPAAASGAGPVPGFAASAPVRKLAALPLASAAALRDRFDLAMQAIALVAEAQEDLRRVARAAGLSIVAEAGAGGEGALCLADYEAHWREAFDHMAGVIDSLVEQEDEEAFAFMLRLMTDNGVVVGADLRAAILRAGEAFAGGRGTDPTA